MDFRVLGPLEASVAGRPVSLGKSKERALLAVLLLHAERVVSIDRLVDELWGERAPGSARKMVQISVSHLRKQLPEGLLRTRPPGYQLALEDHGLDLRRFEQLAAQGRAALRRGLLEEAAETLREALALWRGPALAEFSEPFAEVEGARLAEQQLACVEDRIDADLALGQHHELVGELDALVWRQPLRERLRSQLMLALYRAGRHAEALESYQTFRRRLIDELGIEPSADLKDLERLVLRQDPALATPPVVSSATRMSSPAMRTTPPRSRRVPERLGQAATAEFVGRTPELERLARLVEQAAAGDGAFVAIAGEGGIGKTRLVAELALRAPELVVLYGRCDEDEVTPFGPWVELLTRRLAETPDAELEASLAGQGPSLVRLIPELRWRLPALTAEPDGDPEDERRRLFAAVAALVAGLAAREPLLLVLDDLHWADRSSLLLLRQLASSETLGRVLIVGTYRDTELAEGHPLIETLAGLERDRPAVRVKLRGLDTAEMTTLVTTWKGIELSAETIDALHRETGGNPFFMTQLVRHFEELHDLQAPQAGRGFSIPAGLRDVIVRRVARLPGDAGRILKISALIGREFELGLLQRVAGVAEEQLLDTLDAAVQAGILVEVVDMPGRYSFAHALLRTTLEQELTTTRQARLHARIGEAIELQHREDLDRHVDELARHFAAAGPAEVERAVAYSLRASEQATSRLAYDEAAAYLTTALTLRGKEPRPDESERAQLLALLGTAQTRAGNHAAARAAFHEAAELSAAAGAWPLLAHAVLGYGGGAGFGGVWINFGTVDEELVRLLEIALAACPTGDSHERVRLLGRLAQALYWSPEIECALMLSEEALTSARRLGDPTALAYALDSRHVVLWGPDHLQECRALAHEMLQLGRELHDPDIELEALAWLITDALERDPIEQVDEFIADHARIAAELRQPYHLWYTEVTRAMRAHLDGRLDDAAELCEQAYAYGRKSHGENALQVHAVQSLFLKLELGTVDEPIDTLEEYVAASPLAAWRAVLALALATFERREQALEQVGRFAERGLGAVRRDCVWMTSLTAVSLTVAHLDDATHADELYGLLLPFADRSCVVGGAVLCLGPVSAVLGMLARAGGRPDAALAHFADALERSRALDSPPLVARTQLEAAKAHLLRDGEDDVAAARGLLAEAHATASGMRKLRDEIELVQSRLARAALG
jgi:DNA-binding SARP family transcriptional activator